mmetsp:Transcript_21587/g.50927  ORF Transcript_21587/g.50927 Transcript_21587/m.50927 type:complete len:228 (-) Transcript_21587:252-935(-)
MTVTTPVVAPVVLTLLLSAVSVSVPGPCPSRQSQPASRYGDRTAACSLATWPMVLSCCCCCCCCIGCSCCSSILSPILLSPPSSAFSLLLDLPSPSSPPLFSSSSLSSFSLLSPPPSALPVSTARRYRTAIAFPSCSLVGSRSKIRPMLPFLSTAASSFLPISSLWNWVPRRVRERDTGREGGGCIRCTSSSHLVRFSFSSALCLASCSNSSRRFVLGFAGYMRNLK